jgi:hypothetical protein
MLSFRPRTPTVRTAVWAVVAVVPFAGPTGAVAGTKVVASDGESDDRFGHSVSVDGDTAIVGAMLADFPLGVPLFDLGAAYIFIRSGPLWVEQALLTPDDAQPDDQFGYSVAISGDTVIVAAPFDDDAGNSSGAAYIFVRTGTSWTQQAKLVAADAAPGDEFGFAVALDGDTAIVGSHFDDDAGSLSGAAYIFVRTGTSWTQQAKLVADDASQGDRFGHDVALDGDTAIIGAPYDDDSGSTSGSAYLFTRTGVAWTQQDKIIADDGAQADAFGWSVDLSGDTAVVGAFQDSDAGPNSGSAYVFTRSAAAWTQQDKLTADDAEEFNVFGRSVAVDGDIALIGASGDNDSGPNSGSAYVFTRSGTTWMQEDKLTADDAAALDVYGDSVSLSGATAVVGAFGDDDDEGGLQDLGSAHFYEIAICPADLTDDGAIDGADLGLLLGAWGSAQGDLTGDGVTDGADLGLLLGAWGACP